MDIDILLYGNQVGIIDGVELLEAKSPSTHLLLRPLVDVACRRHPTLDISFQQLWESFDQLSQKPGHPFRT